MRTIGTLAACMLAVISCALLSCRQAPAQGYQLDLTLEGPWMLYQDHGFLNTKGETVTALIAIAPSVMTVSQSALQHQPPMLLAGDGFTVNEQISCVIFDGLCGGTALPTAVLTPSAGYYPPTLISLNKSSSSWHWYSSDLITKAYVVILPMPDSYSDDGTWPVRLSDTYSFSQQTSPAEFKTQAIGLHLHYTKGPTQFTIAGCDASYATQGKCPIANTVKQSIANTGTIRLVMKSPVYKAKDKFAICDPHVRAAYRQMLFLLDKTPFNSLNQKNINSGKAFLDPARGIANDGTPGVEDDNQCHSVCDAELPGSPTVQTLANPKCSPELASGQVSKGGHGLQQGDTGKSLSDLFTEVVTASNQPLFHDNDELKRLRNQINSLRNAMDPEYPRISQLTVAAALIRAYGSAIPQEKRKLDSSQKTARAATPEDRSQSFTEASQAYLEAYDAQFKDGKDCRAAIAQIKD